MKLVNYTKSQKLNNNFVFQIQNNLNLNLNKNMFWLKK